MIGVIIVGSMRQEQVRLEIAYETDELLPCFEGRQQTAVGMVEYIIAGADDGGGGLSLGAATSDKRLAAQDVMAGAAVGDADELDLVAKSPPARGSAAGLVVGIVGVSAQDKNAEWWHGASRVREWENPGNGHDRVSAKIQR
jgi:hypothetical protein